jgi:hypothetical protein
MCSGGVLFYVTAGWLAVRDGRSNRQGKPLARSLHDVQQALLVTAESVIICGSSWDGAHVRPVCIRECVSQHNRVPVHAV